MPEDLPLLEKHQIPDKGGFRLNPFISNGQRLRLVGVRKTSGGTYWKPIWEYNVKNETTGVFKWKTQEWMDTVTAKNK